MIRSLLFMNCLFETLWIIVHKKNIFVDYFIKKENRKVIDGQAKPFRFRFPFYKIIKDWENPESLFCCVRASCISTCGIASRISAGSQGGVSIRIGTGI